MSDEEMSEDYPDFDRIKSSPSTSPLSLPSRENSVILEARDVHQLDLRGASVMPHDNGSPYNSPPQHLNYETPAPTPVRSNRSSCHIQIMEEPEEKFRFRYKSEMQGTHGCIHGKHYTKKSKKFPEVHINNVPAGVDTVRLRVALYTNESPRKHHVHKVMWKQFSESEQDFIEVDLHRSKGFKHVWQGLGIIHTSRRFINDIIFSRIRRVFLEQKGASQGTPHAMLTDAEELQLKNDAGKMGKEMSGKLNTVLLGFEAFRVENGGIYYPLCSMAFTNPINNLKNPSTGELKICRISSYAGSVAGGDEVFIFIERVKKGDIQVRFFQLDENDERCWEALAHFTEADVHHQFAIAFTTPPYEDQTVTEDVQVFFELFRPSDSAFSDHREFRYKPREDIRIGIKRPRPNYVAHRQPIPESPIVETNGNGNGTDLQGNGTDLLGNLIQIHDLLRDEDYMETLNEPSPYDTVIKSTSMSNSEVMPDLLNFSRPVMELSLPVITIGHSQMSTIATDSAGPARPVQPVSGHRELTNEMLRTMTNAMSNLTTICKSDETRDKIRQSMIDIENSDGNNVVHVAVLSKEISALKIITDMLVNLNVEDVLNYGNKNNSTPLQLAVETDQLEAVRMLLDSKAETHVMDREGETPVHSAVKNNNIALLKLLLSYDANANIPNNYGKFPIHTAVENNFLEIVKILVDNGADVDSLNQVTGKTPTHIAVERNLEDMVNFLVKDAQADVTRLDFGDLAPSDVAEYCKSNTIKRLLSKEMKKQS